MDPFNDSDLDSPAQRSGCLPRYRGVFNRCQESIVGQFSDLFKQFFSRMDDFMLGLADVAETNSARNHCFEVMHDILVRQPDMERKFTLELARGFENFAAGRSEPLRSGSAARKNDQLSLIEKDDYEISLGFANVLHAANNLYSAHLFALNHRLAIVNGGVKLGEYNPALPGSPAQICDALQNSLDILDMPVSHKIKIALVKEFERRVLTLAEGIYAGFNDTLIEAGILPNLSLEAIGYKPNPPGGDPSAAIPGEAQGGNGEEPAETEAERRTGADRRAEAEDQGSSLDREIFNSIQEILARRHAGNGQRRQAAPVQTNFADLMSSLNLLQISAPPLNRQQITQLPIETVKEAFSEQMSKLAEIVKSQQINSADADIIDLVGMLFEFILNDNSLPDSVKALLSHLHTPILKVALLDKKFFFRSKHPARRLLNALTQAGALCNAEDNDDNGVFAKMQSVVDDILQHFDENTELFTTVLEDFNEFLEGFNRRSKVFEKRTVESAKGRERLREARQTVSQEIVDRTWNRTLPKVAEELLLGPWANLLVLTNLRNGADSEEWKRALALVDEVLWSLEPKTDPREQAKLRERLPAMEETIRNGLAVIGDPEVNTKALIQELKALYEQNLNLSPRRASPAPSSPPEPQAKPAPRKPAPIWEDVEVTAPGEQQPFLREADPILLAIVDELRGIKLGSSFEFTESGGKKKIRAKLSWYSPKTSYYIFVNQTGIQVAVKSLRTLAKEIRKGETRIVQVARKPLMDRALESINALLRSPEDVDLAWAKQHFSQPQ
jgi:hypothetical protein